MTLPTPPREDIDYLCTIDGRIYRGPDTGDVIPTPGIRTFEYNGQTISARDWPIVWKGHYIGHSVCPEHSAPTESTEEVPA
jgi:hypothetical protein